MKCETTVLHGAPREKYACVLLPVRCSVFPPVACTTFAFCLWAIFFEKKTTKEQDSFKRGNGSATVTYHFSHCRGSSHCWVCHHVVDDDAMTTAPSTDTTPLLAFFSELRAQLHINGSLSSPLLWRNVGVSLSLTSHRCT